jgi:hypothetical protein
MIYFPSPNVAYHHIHKTGGTSFKHALRSLFPDSIELDPWPHHPIPYYSQKLKELGVEPDKVDILTLIRDPLHHLVSIYHFWRQSGDPQVPAVQIAKRASFADFVVEFVGTDPNRRAFQRILYVDSQIPANVRILRLEHWRPDLDRLNYP